jgi:cbb3-type cytochrome oxidase subunit 3
MFDWLCWFTNMENTTPFFFVLFSITFFLFIFYFFTNRKRSKRLESYKNIPFQEDNENGQSKDIKNEQ